MDETSPLPDIDEIKGEVLSVWEIFNLSNASEKHISSHILKQGHSFERYEYKLKCLNALP